MLVVSADPLDDTCCHLPTRFVKQAPLHGSIDRLQMSCKDSSGVQLKLKHVVVAMARVVEQKERNCRMTLFHTLTC